MRNTTILIFWGLALGLLTDSALAQTRPATQPALRGIAEKCPSDAGIDKDPAVIFADDFERDQLVDLGMDTPSR